MRRRISAPLVMAAAGVLSLWACATNPVTGQRQLALISERQEIDLGRAAAGDVERTIGLVDDAELQAYVRRVGLSLARTSERPNLPWTFGVVDDPTPNAFALPGGYIYITRGMATLMNSEAEMASVLGHEIGHVTARHSVSQISQQQLAQLGLGVGGLIIPELEPYGGLLSAGLGLLFLRHSREAERQADDLGFKYALGGGYAVTEMADVFRALERMAPEGRTALPSFLTTHPSPGERVATIEAKVAGLPSGSRGTRVGEAEYLRQIDGLVFGEDPTQGFFRNSEFLHPSLRFRFAFPRGWTGENLRQAVLLSSARQDAALQLTIAGQSSPDAAARQFGSQQGVALGGLSRQSINGLSAVVGSFEAATESGRLVGLGGWISHGGRTYQLLAYTSASAFPSYENAFGQVIGSFGPLRDAVALGVQPKRVDIVTVPARLTLSEFNRRMPSSVSLDLLSVLNGVSGPSAVLAQGELAKRIVN